MKKIFFSLALLLTIHSLFAQSTAEYTQVLSRFEQWKTVQYNAGNYARPAGCKMEIVTKEGYKGPVAGIPKEIAIYFSDINQDGKTDGLITFNPVQCDGGNAMMNVQARVMIISKGASWVTDDKYIENMEAKKDGWLSVSGAREGTIFGTYYAYGTDDPRCCPSIKKLFTIDYKTKKLLIESD